MPQIVQHSRVPRVPAYPSSGDLSLRVPGEAEPGNSWCQAANAIPTTGMLRVPRRPMETCQSAVLRSVAVKHASPAMSLMTSVWSGSGNVVHPIVNVTSSLVSPDLL